MSHKPSPTLRLMRQQRPWISASLAGLMALWQIGQPLHATTLTEELSESSTDATLITGGTGLQLNGGGSIRLTNVLNDYTGVTSLNNGSLIISNGAVLGTDTSAILIRTTNNTPLNNSMVGFGGGSLVLDGTTAGFNLARNISFEGRGPLGDRSAAIRSLGNNTLSGILTSAVSPLALSPTASIRNSRINSVNGLLTISGILNVGGTAGTTITSLGGVNTAGVNNFSFAGGNLAGTGTLEKSGSGVLDLNGNASTFTGTVRTGASSVGQQSSIRVTQTTVGGTSVFGASATSGNTAAIDLNGGILEFRSNSNLDFNALTTGKNVYLRASTVVYTGPAGGGDVVNGLTTLGAFRVAQGQTATFRSRNGFGATLQAWTQESSNGNTGIANEMGGTLTFTGDAWNNADGSTRDLTFSGNGNTRIVGNITASGTDKRLVKQGTGELILNGTAGTFTGGTFIQGGAVRITDFRSINNNTQNISLGNGTTTAGALIIGGTGTGTGTALGLTTSKPILWNVTTAQSAIYANQAGVNPVILNGAITSVLTTGNYNLGGSNPADNIINQALPAGTTGGLTKSGAGTWVLNAANLYTGATTIQGGTLKLRATAPASNVILETATNLITFTSQATAQTAGGILEFRGDATAVTTETLGALTPTAGAATVRLLGQGGFASNLVFNNATAALGATTAATSVNFDTTGANGGTVSFTGVAPAAATATTLPGTTNFQGHLYLNGAGFADVVAGVVTAPTYGGAGNFRDAGAALVAATHNRLTVATASGAATISSLLTNNQTLTLSGNLVVSTGGILQSGGTASILSNDTTARLIQGGGATTNVAIRVNLGTDVLNLGNATNPAIISGTTTGGLTKNGLGNLVVFGTNAQTGATTINEGKVTLNGAAARLSAITANLVVRQGATLDLLAGVTAANAVVNNLDGAGTISGQSGQTFTTTGTGTWNGVFSGTGFNITKSAGGNATWSGVSTYTGVTTIGGTGLVTVDTLANGGANSGIGASSNAASNLVFTGSTAGIDYRGNIIDTALTLGSRSATTDRLFTLAAAATGANLTSTVSNNNAIVWSNTGSIVNNTTANATLTFGGTSTGDNTFKPRLVDSSVGGGVTLAVTKSGAGQWNLGSATNSYTGATTIADGVLGLNDSGALPTNSPLVLGAAATSGIIQTSGSFARTLSATPTAGTGTITWGGTAGGGFAAHATSLSVTLNAGAGLTWGSGGFVPTGASLILNSGSSLADVTFTNDIDLGAVARTVTVNDNGQTGADYANLTGVLSGAGGGLFKNGTGILRVGNANTYTGVTSVDAGTLVVSSLGNSSAPGASSVGNSAVGNTDAGAVVLGNATTTGGNLVYVGAGETSDRKIRLRGTTANSAIYADGAGPLILTNVAHDTVETGAKTLSLRGTNTAGNTISSVLANNGVNALTVAVDGGATWILNNALNSYTGGTTAGSGALGIGDNAALGTAALTNSNGNVFAHGADRTIANAVTLSNNATNGWIGDYSLTVNGVTNLAAAANNVNTNNSIVAGKVLTFNNGVTANALTANRAWLHDGPGETIVNGTFSTTTGFGARFDVNGGGTLTLGTTGATSDWNKSILAADVDRGTLKFSVNNAIPTTFTGATSTAPVTNAGTTITVASTAGLVVGQTFSGTSITAGTRIASIIDGTSFVASAAPTAALVPGATLTFVGSGGVTLTPDLATADTARIDLNGTTQTFNAFTATDTGTSIIDNSSASAATLIVGAGNTAATFGTGGTGTYSITETGGGAINLGKIGTGTANFTGTLGNTGTVTSNGGTLNLNSATGAAAAVADGGNLFFKGGFTTPGNLLSVTTDNGGLLSFASGAGTPFANLTSLNLSLTANAGLELDVGDTAIDKLTTAAASVANVTTLFIKDIDITGGTTYDLIANAGGGLGVLGNYLLNLPGYSGSSLTVTPTLVQLNAGTLITSDVYWNNGTGLGGGTLTQAWNTVDGVTTNINFSGVVAGTPALQLNENLPGKGQKVIFQGDNITGGAPLATTLEQAFTVNTLEFRQSTTAADTSRTISIAPGAVSSNSLTLKPSLATDGINLQTGATGTVSISAPFVAGTDQTWTVADAPVELTAAVIAGTTVTPASTAGLRPGMTVTGTGIAAGTTIVSVGATTFEVSVAPTAGTVNILAAQQLNMNGALSGPGDVVKAGAGKVVLGASNGTLMGTYTNNAGITQVNLLSALGGQVGVPGSGADITVTGGSFFYNNGTAGTFVNDIALNGGTLASGGQNHTYSGNVNVSANSNVSLRDQAADTAAFGVARNVTLSGVVSGTNAITLDGNNTVSAGNQSGGTLTLNNSASTWSGALNLTRGTVAFTNVANAGNATSYVGYDGIINFNQFGRVQYRNIDGGALTRTAALNFAAGAVGELAVDNVGALASNYTITQSGAVNLNAGSAVRIFISDVASNLSVTGGVVLNGNASISVVGGDADSLVTISGTGISGTGDLAINDDAGGWAQTNSRLAINAAGTFTGNTTLSEGTLLLGHKDALSTGSLTIAGASTITPTVDLSTVVPNALTLNANLTVAGAQNITFGGNFIGAGADANRTLTNSLTSGTLVLSGATSSIGAAANTAARTLTIAGAGTTTVSANLADGNAFANALSITNTAVTTLSGANTYSGTTTLNAAAGTLLLQGSNSSAGATTLTTGKIQLDSASNGGLASGLLTLTAGTLEPLNAARSLTNAATLGGNITVIGSQDLTIGGLVTNSGGNRTFTNNSTGIVRLNSVNLTESTARTLTLAGTGAVQIGTVTNNGGNNVISSTTTGGLTIDTNVYLSESLVTARTLTVGGAGNTTISGVIDNANGVGVAGGLTKTGAGTLTLSNTNLYTGTTSLSPASGVNNGVILATATNALGTGPVSSVIPTAVNTAGQIQLSGGITLGNSSFTTSGVGTDGTNTGIIRSVSGNNVISGALNMTGGGGASTYRADSGSSLTVLGNVGAVGGNVSRIVNLVGAGDFVFAGIIQNFNDANTAGTVGVNSANTGTTTLSGINTYTLATTVASGSTLIAGSTQAFGVNSATAVAGTLRLAGNNNTIGALSGAGTVENANATAATLSSPDYAGFTGVIQDGAGAGSLGITKTGAGTSIIAGAHTFTGKTTIANGTLSVASIDATASAAQALGAGTDLDLGVAATSSGRLLYTGAATTLSKNVNVLGTGSDTIENGGSGLLTLSGTLTKAGTTLNLVGGASGILVTGTIVGVPSSSDLVIGAGTTTLAAANTYNGPTILNSGGTLNINNANAISTGAFTINGGTIDNTSGAAITLATNNPLNINSNFTFTGTNSLNLGTGAVTLDANRTVTVSGNTLTVGGAISGAFNLTGAGAGTLVLTGASTYTGTTTAQTGTTISVGGNGSLGDISSGTVVDNGASLALNSVLYTDAEALTINGTGVGGGGALQTTGTSSFAGPITAATNATINNTGTLGLTGGLVKDATTLTLAGSGTYNISGTGISGASANSDLIVSAATVNLNVANTYNGPTFIRNGGTINANVANALPTAIARTAIIMDDTGSGSSTLALGSAQSAASLTSAVTTSQINVGASQLTVGAASGSTNFAGTIVGTGGSIVKDGASTQTLSGANTYSGGTTVNDGTLNVTNTTGSATGSGTVTVGTSGTLAGTGTVEAGSGNFIMINGTLQVGDSTLGVPVASTLEVKTSGGGSMVLGSASIVKFDLFTGAGLGDSSAISTAADQIRLFGSLDAATTPGSTLLLAYVGAGTFMAGDMWKLFDLSGPGTISGAFNINYSGLGLGPLLAAELNHSTGILSIVTVPEPSRALLYLIGLMGIFFRRRRR